ncbi:MAG: PAS domain-containing protein [Rubrivivax sp.]|nr:PAS domain-containing protein [Rubrivivax sp.]
MRKNLPVTQREVKMPAGSTLLSTTDPDSRITYANAAFVQVSGYQHDELMGQPHNIVRHPDMPIEAFADMWRTIRSGQPWSALVKNRRKDGDHYWVRANATSVVRDGRLVGFMSVRTPASPTEIDAAERLYADFRAGRAKGLGFERGLLVHTGWGRWRSLSQLLPLAPRLGLCLAAGLLPLLAAGLYGAAGGTDRLLVLSAGASGLLLAGWCLRRQVVRPIALTLKQALAVASGQPVEPMVMDRADEIGTLLRAVNQAGLNLRALVDDVAEQVGGVETASREIAAGSQDLSARTEQAASSLQQTSAAMEQLSGAIRQNAEAAREVSSLSLQARGIAQQGGSAMQDMVEHMMKIGQSSNRIADIVGLIDGIAFRTNILALNAAVEAARAGEQGRGFAVVAAEVRSLAQRAAEAAREIRTLIDASAGTIARGGERVQAAGSTMAQIVAQVDRVTTLIAEMSQLTGEQASGVAQVHQAVATMDESTQHNAALVEQSAAAAESLSHQASRLAEAVGVYRAR